ncbi:MAG: hypothetical protein LW823_09525 [Rickettsiales bacterium]|jgi:hypothetical protein|nr:hypothetical protein [Rickettsiales bacterium]
MNQRVLLLASFLLLPIVLIVFLAQTPETSNMKPVKPEEPAVQTGSLSKAPERLPALVEPRKQEAKPPRRPPTLDEAKERLKKELARLETLTPEEWEKEQRERDERRRARLKKERETKQEKEKK